MEYFILGLRHIKNSKRIWKSYLHLSEREDPKYYFIKLIIITQYLWLYCIEVYKKNHIMLFILHFFTCNFPTLYLKFRKLNLKQIKIWVLLYSQTLRLNYGNLKIPFLLVLTRPFYLYCFFWMTIKKTLSKIYLTWI